MGEDRGSQDGLQGGMRPQMRPDGQEPGPGGQRNLRLGKRGPQKGPNINFEQQKKMQALRTTAEAHKNSQKFFSNRRKLTRP